MRINKDSIQYKYDQKSNVSTRIYDIRLGFTMKKDLRYPNLEYPTKSEVDWSFVDGIVEVGDKIGNFWTRRFHHRTGRCKVVH